MRAAGNGQAVAVWVHSFYNLVSASHDRSLDSRSAALPRRHSLQWQVIAGPSTHARSK
jgi:hypothetical protein